MYSLGIDIGGTKCAVVLGDETFSSDNSRYIIAKRSFSTCVERGWRSVIAEIFTTVDLILKDNSVTTPEKELVGIGISCGGPLNSKTGTIHCPPNLPDWDGVPIVDMFTQRYSVKTSLQNDANACALAEWKYGAARGAENVIFLTFGTGMGAGLILNGKLYSGTNDMAGEVGHIRLSEDGPEGYGKNGSFEGFCSGGGIHRLSQMLAGNGKYNPKDALPADAKTLAERMYANDNFAKDVYIRCAEKLAAGLSIIIDILNPEVIVIGSIYARNREFFDSIILPIINTEALPYNAEVCKILPAELGESIGDFAALGVAGL